MHEDHVTENRINRELFERIVPAEVSWRSPLEVQVRHLGTDPLPLEQVRDEPFVGISPGERWGSPWATSWFRVGGGLPEEAPGGGVLEVHADIGFSPAMAGFQAEATVYVKDRIRCGLHPRQRELPASEVSDGDRIDFLVEASANPDMTSSFTANPLGDPATAGSEPLYVYRGFDLVEVQPEVRSLRLELSTLNDLMRSLERGSARRVRLLRTLGRALDRLDLHRVAATASAAREVLAEELAVPAAPDAHRLHAVGHAHIDTAWLWPLRETRRKCARTFSNQVRLMERHPEHVFACSQAAQYAFVEEDHPTLFADIETMVGRGQWVPVGGMWVEADMNLPNGESLVRQLVHGQRYFEDRFGSRCREVWIPDVFGYPGNLPQIFRAAGCDRFLTQKLSWNKQNRFPHHSFTWEGIDGSTVIAHFPPVDTYNSELSAREVTRSVRNFADAAWSDHSLVPFGFGDGGGGPNPEMLERARLLGNVSGAPRLAIDPPAVFFDELERELARPDTPRWRGELYFEMHRGTFTSQARTKVGNRRCEGLLREAELWAAVPGASSEPAHGHEAPGAELERLWKRVLVQQFHDIIPGSSIAWVHDDAEAEHRDVAARLEEMIASMLAGHAVSGPVVANPATHRRAEVVSMPDEVARLSAGDGPRQVLGDGSTAMRVVADGMATTALEALEVTDTVSVGPDHLENGSVALRLDHAGEIVSILDRRAGRELIPGGCVAGRLLLAPDHPVEYDAWDLEEWTVGRSVPLAATGGVEVIEAGPLRGRIRTTHRFGSSEVRRTVSLDAASARIDVHLEMDWHEDEKLLSIDFPLDVRADTAACEAQFGHLERPTHRSTSWDAAKFEVCAQRWVDLSEPSFGVAVLNDGRYGHGVQDGGVRVSLLRAARYPDPDADRGTHEVTVSLLPHGPGLAEVVCEAEALNAPLRVVAPDPDGDRAASPGAPTRVLDVSDRRVAVSAVKRADDGSGDLVVRLWEATGDRVRTFVQPRVAASSVVACNLLEEPLADRPGPELTVSGGATVELRPFELVTLRFSGSA